MSVQDTNKIDSIGTDIDTDIVILSIIDDIDWQDEQYHLSLLQEKLNIYLSFIESGEVYEAYPESNGKKFEIKIYAQYPLPPAANDFMSSVSGIIQDAGFRFSFVII